MDIPLQPVVNRTAPVLIIPDVIPPDLGRTLIDLWHAHSEESFMMVEQADGSLARMYDRDTKARLDHFIEDHAVLEALRLRFTEKVCPAIQEAFRFDVTRFEEFRVGCYDASTGGYFRPHRDDTLEGVAHRMFGIAISLNVGEYEGGCLAFPEHDNQLYRADSGAAVVFSGHMLHEVTPVVSGRRFALVTFLYGEKESRQRKAYYQRSLLGTEVPLLEPA